MNNQEKRPVEKQPGLIINEIDLPLDIVPRGMIQNPNGSKDVYSSSPKDLTSHQKQEPSKTATDNDDNLGEEKELIIEIIEDFEDRPREPLPLGVKPCTLFIPPEEERWEWGIPIDENKIN